ncbi:MAG: hypothetical protein ACYDBB_18625 [Armatimonadota bacterium]
MKIVSVALTGIRSRRRLILALYGILLVGLIILVLNRERLIAQGKFVDTPVKIQQPTLFTQKSPYSELTGRESRWSNPIIPAITPDGSLVSWQLPEHAAWPFSERPSEPNEIIVYHRKTGRVELTGMTSNEGQFGVVPADDDSASLVFATNEALDPADTNRLADIYLVEGKNRVVTWVSKPSADSQAMAGASSRPVISTNGKVIAFVTLAQNLISPPGNGRLCLYDVERKMVEDITLPFDLHGRSTESIGTLSLSADGGFIAFDALRQDKKAKEGIREVVIYDQQTKQFAIATHVRDGQQLSGRAPSISADGRYCAYVTATGVVVYDRNTLNITPIKVKEGMYVWSISRTCISSDGRYVAFDGKTKEAHSAIHEDIFATDLMLADTKTGDITYVTDGNAALQQQLGLPFHENRFPSMSQDGRYICYATRLSNVSPTSSSGYPSGKKWNGHIYTALAIHVYDRETKKSSLIFQATDLPADGIIPPASSRW